MNRDPRFTLSRELEAKQTLLDQLHALATDDPDFFTDVLEGETMATPRKLAQAADWSAGLRRGQTHAAEGLRSDGPCAEISGTKREARTGG